MKEEINNPRRTFHTDIECVPEGHANGKATNAHLDKEIIINSIYELCEFNIDISINLIQRDNNILKEREQVKEVEKEHELLNDVVKIFKGKIIS